MFLGAHRLECYREPWDAAGALIRVNSVRKFSIGSARIGRNVDIAAIDVFRRLGPQGARASIDSAVAKDLNRIAAPSISGFWSSFYWSVLLLTTFMPKLFVGEIVITPMRELLGVADLLSPTTQNFTQFGYVALSVMTVFAVTLMADEPAFIKTLLASLSLEASSVSSPVLSISQQLPPGWKACSSNSEMRIMPT